MRHCDSVLLVFRFVSKVRISILITPTSQRVAETLVALKLTEQLSGTRRWSSGIVNIYQRSPVN